MKFKISNRGSIISPDLDFEIIRYAIDKKNKSLTVKFEIRNARTGTIYKDARIKTILIIDGSKFKNKIKPCLKGDGNLEQKIKIQIQKYLLFLGGVVTDTDNDVFIEE